MSGFFEVLAAQQAAAHVSLTLPSFGEREAEREAEGVEPKEETKRLRGSDHAKTIHRHCAKSEGRGSVRAGQMLGPG